MFESLNRIIIVCGHYGSGKTNFAVNLAIALRKAGHAVNLCDMDIVNPYFRTADFQEVADQNDIHLVVPPFANTNLDIPALTGAYDSAIEDENAYTILDVGGDDAGATVLGMYHNKIESAGYSMLYVLNQFRYFDKEEADCVSLLRDIEAVSRLRATHLVNNSNLSYETKPEDIINSQKYADAIGPRDGVARFVYCGAVGPG